MHCRFPSFADRERIVRRTLDISLCRAYIRHISLLNYFQVGGVVITPSIDIDEALWDLLKREAEPFVDTPNSVLRRLLGVTSPAVTDAGAERDPSASGAAAAPSRQGRAKTSKRQRRRGPRAPVGSLLPESEYEEPILRVLGDRDGHAPARDVIRLVGALVDDRLTPLDREELPNGLQRWQSRVQFTRLRLRKAGLIKDDSPRGVWELSDKGLDAFRKLGPGT